LAVALDANVPTFQCSNIPAFGVLNMGMIDVTDKPVVHRTAEAAGKIHLSAETVEVIQAGKVKKGDPLLVAEVAGMNAAKQTHLLIPHCHQLPLDTVEFTFRISGGSIEARCLVKAQARTGVEMEALVGVSIALDTLWDMVKYLEKNAEGQYPHTRISDIRVIQKRKEP
jgi:cyclic pyranopterin phosphate synthase